MKMKTLRRILWLVPLLLGTNVQVCIAAPMPDKVSLCHLQGTAKLGKQRSVQVSGIYRDGFEIGVLTDTACPSEHTWAELDLQSTTNKETLRSMLDTAGQAEVVFEGTFYGAEVPDSELPEAIRKSYQAGWDHLGVFRTKLVVYAIQSLSPVPADHPAAADLSHDVPYRQEAALPVYPPIGRAASVTGALIVAATISGGKVTNIDVKSGARLLVGGTVANLKTWRFADDVNGTLTVTYTYAISGEETDSLMNPTVEMLPSLDVNITSRPVKLIPMHGARSASATDSPVHESSHSDGPKPQ
jgi:hypothetical protein